MTYYRHRNFSSSSEKGKITLSLSIIFGLILLSIFYLVQTNQLVAKNFELRNFRSALEQRQEQNQKLLIFLTQKGSLNNLENAAKNLNLVVVEKINYLKTVPGFFALSQKPCPIIFFLDRRGWSIVHSTSGNSPYADSTTLFISSSDTGML